MSNPISIEGSRLGKLFAINRLRAMLDNIERHVRFQDEVPDEPNLRQYVRELWPELFEQES